MRHFFFKFGESNCFFDKCLKNSEKESFEINDTLPLSIYFGKWTVEDYEAGKTINGGKDKDQIDRFFNAAMRKPSESVFWIFDKRVFALKPYSEVYNGTMTRHDYSNPKSVDSRVVKIFPKEKLPEAFASINSYQKYNRKTIVELENKEVEIAEWILSNRYSHGKMPIRRDNMLHYLSPLQFETLIFLIFHHHSVFCTTYRGGTLEGVDFRIQSTKMVDIHGLKFNGQAVIQVKKRNYIQSHPQLKLDKDFILVHLGDSEPEKNILGTDWIQTCVTELPAVDRWLNQSLAFFHMIGDD